MENSSSDNKTKTQICRLCLALTTRCFSLVENNEASAMLEALTSLKILPSDDISTVMCLKCQLNLKLAFSIQQNMLRAEQRFRERLLSTQIKQESDLEQDEIPASSNDTEEQTLYDHDNKNTVLSELRSYTCDICGISKPSRKNLVKHKYNVHRKVKCPICNKDVTQVHLKHHLETHESSRSISASDKDGPYTCDICGKTKPSKATLAKHKYNVHVELKCPICDKDITQTNMKRHIERHKDPLAVCEFCGATMKSQDLRVHIYYKHSNLSFKCKFCDKTFKKKSSKVAHENRDHLEEANFVCDTCGKKFYRSRYLKQHVQSTHLKLRPHICDFCNVGFSSKHAMRTHRRQHTNETPFKCDVCGDGFKQKVSLKGHLKSKHNIEEELTCECTTCGKKFASKAALISHNRIH